VSEKLTCLADPSHVQRLMKQAEIDHHRLNTTPPRDPDGKALPRHRESKMSRARIPHHRGQSGRAFFGRIDVEAATSNCLHEGGFIENAFEGMVSPTSVVRFRPESSARQARPRIGFAHCSCPATPNACSVEQPVGKWRPFGRESEQPPPFLVVCAIERKLKPAPAPPARQVLLSVADRGAHRRHAWLFAGQQQGFTISR